MQRLRVFPAVVLLPLMIFAFILGTSTRPRTISSNSELIFDATTERLDFVIEAVHLGLADFRHNQELRTLASSPAPQTLEAQILSLKNRIGTLTSRFTYVKSIMILFPQQKLMLTRSGLTAWDAAELPALAARQFERKDAAGSHLWIPAPPQDKYATDARTEFRYLLSVHSPDLVQPIYLLITFDFAAFLAPTIAEQVPGAAFFTIDESGRILFSDSAAGLASSRITPQMLERFRRQSDGIVERVAGTPPKNLRFQKSGSTDWYYLLMSDSNPPVEGTGLLPLAFILLVIPSAFLLLYHRSILPPLLRLHRQVVESETESISPANYDRRAESGEGEDTDFPHAEASTLIAAITRGDGEAATESLDECLGYLKAGGESISGTSIAQLFFLLRHYSEYWEDRPAIDLDAEESLALTEIDGNQERALFRLHTVVRLLSESRVVHISNSTRKTIEEVKDYIHKNYTETITLETLAGHCGYTPQYLSLVFKKITGVNAIAYINSIRVQQAKALLQNSCIAVGEIPEQVGFNNHQYFHRIFKRSVGCSPSEYRRNLAS